MPAGQGVDGVAFAKIEDHGIERWLKALQEEPRSDLYTPQPLLRVWIAKRSGGQRPLSIPTVKDRVVQTAVVLVLGPIFEGDLLPQQYGFRPGLDAKAAVRKVYFHITQRRRSEIVDADLSEYFSTIPHSPLLRCVVRRVADRQILSVLKRWLVAPVWERISRGATLCTTEARDRKRGVPQGGSASPMLANLYFRRFLLVWHQQGHANRLDATVVNYADDVRHIEVASEFRTQV